MAGSNRGDSSGIATRSVASNNQLFRRRRSKGTIAGFAHSRADESSITNSSGPETNGEMVSSDNIGTTGHDSLSVNDGNQPQHTSDASSNTIKPCHSARLALLCCHNAIRMGARTQLGLCPPGRARRGLQAALRQRIRQQSSGRRLLPANLETGGYFGLDKMIGAKSLENHEEEEEDYLLSTNSFDVESDEEASSGDEDDLNNINELLSAEPSKTDHEKKYLILREPIFTPAGAEPSLSNPNGALSMASMGGAGTSKLPFNRRKIRYFDSVAASDMATARSYLQKELAKCRQRSTMVLTRRLKRLQREQRRRLRIEQGLIRNGESDTENDDPDGKIMFAGGVSQFENPMTSSMSAALIIESLSLNPLESVEGMEKCYDGIVAAGVALLDSQIKDPTSPTGEEEKPRPSRSKIMAALAPLLITSLEHPSGEVILLLARLRQMCGTYRYQRRFVQRMAPFLIRPPRAALWCLRHQNDMEPIIAAVELIFDLASDVFSKGWYDRGQLILADSKRAETLNTAAIQLRNLSAEHSEGLSLGLHHSHGHRRIFMATHSQGKDSSNSANGLAEWEVIAVDQQIRISISNIMSSDWSRVQPKDDNLRSYSRRSVGPSSRRPSVLPQSLSGEASPRSLNSPRSPIRMVVGVNTPLSPPNVLSSSSGTSQVENLDGAFAVTLPSQPTLSGGSISDRPLSADETTSTQSPPTLPYRTSIEEVDSQTQLNQLPNATPPRSPRSSANDDIDLTQSAISSSAPSITPNSPRRHTALSGTQRTRDSSESNEHSSLPFTPSLIPVASSAPLSPSSPGTSASDLVSYRPSSSSSVSSIPGSSQTAHYRMLTSTASERKRTVAACRALRAQITTFEDAFFQLHNRPPKGAAERAPLATTYLQYREWKRAIRADAACRIQALFRGAGTRLILLRSNDSKVRRVVRVRAGLPVVSNDKNLRIISGQGQENMLSQIGNPTELDNESEKSLFLEQVSGGVDVYAAQNTSQSYTPQWASQIVRRRSDLVHENVHTPPASSRPPSLEYANLPLPDLQARKRDLKQQLKQYDMNFARRHGRMPVKAEKEPIRHLYENYNSLKGQINMIEQDGRHPHPSPTPSVNSSIRSVSTASTNQTPESGNDELIRRGNRNRRRSPPPIASSVSPSQDLTALKAEKGQLHQMLRSYEKDFFREHRRQVSSFADIRPVASQYRRYKETKRAIAALQLGSDN